MSNFVSNAAAILFAIGGVMGLLAIFNKPNSLTLVAVGLLLACVAGLVITLAP